MNKLVFILLSALALGAHAADKSARPAVVERMTEIDMQMGLMQKEMEYRKLLDQREAAEMGGAGMPKILEVFPLGAGMGAKLVYADGVTKTIRENQEIDGRVVVLSITPAGVVVKKGAKKQSLSFATNAPASSVQGQSATPQGQVAAPGSFALPPMPAGMR